MRRYQLNYHVVGGFSFYERAEIKDMISYLKVIQNPDDSIALQRVINTPTRGIGKTTMETWSASRWRPGPRMWGAINEVLRRRLLSARALAALKSFKELIDDARAMHLGTFCERVERNRRRTAAEPCVAERRGFAARYRVLCRGQFEAGRSPRNSRQRPLPKLA